MDEPRWSTHPDSIGSGPSLPPRLDDTQPAYTCRGRCRPDVDAGQVGDTYSSSLNAAPLPLPALPAPAPALAGPSLHASALPASGVEPKPRHQHNEQRVAQAVPKNTIVLINAIACCAGGGKDFFGRSTLAVARLLSQSTKRPVAHVPAHRSTAIPRPPNWLQAPARWVGTCSVDRPKRT